MASFAGQLGPTKLELAMQKAASELAKAAVESADGLAVASLKELEQIKVSGATAVVLAEQTKTAIETSAKAEAASLFAIKASMDTLKATMIQSEKMQHLRWAYDHATIGEFEFYESTTDMNKSTRSGVYVQQVLLTFMANNGKFLAGHCFEVRSWNYSAEQKEAGKLAFQTKLVAQLTSLLGGALRVANAGTPPRPAIFYE